MDAYRTPLRRARGLGAAKHGVSVWLFERISAAALIPLTIWAVWAGLTLARTDFAGAVIWLQSPVNAVLLALLTGVGFAHMHAGMRVIIEDYLARPSTRVALLGLNMAACGLAGALAEFCILKVALGGGGV